MTNRICSLHAAFAMVICASISLAQDAAPIVLENDLVRYEIGADGHNLKLLEKASGTDYLTHDAPSAVAYISFKGNRIDATSALKDGDDLQIGFGDSGVKAKIGVRMEKRYWAMRVKEVIPADGVESLTFANIPLSVKGTLDEPFTGCALAMDLQTNVAEIPGPNPRMVATCYPRFGMTGASVSVIACPTAQLRDVMKEAVDAADQIPRTHIGGPWALDSDGNRGSYLFDFGSCTEKTVDSWIALVKQLGLNQIDFHTGSSLRFGDCQPNPELFPNGRASVKAVIDKLHAAGIMAGLHTYAFFMAKNTPYVTPVPDPRLGKFASYTLSGAITADATTVPVDESTADVSTITGFFVRNSVTIQIDNELITFAGVSKEAPYGFTQCTRGALGTTAAPHEKGAKAHHIRECFGLFAPDADSTLLDEVAANTANTFNECGFDMIYLDALDGEDILGGSENSWHYGSKFAWAIAKRLNRPALFEMSTFHHHLWFIRARMGAWDHPTRSHKEFIDTHVQGNLSGAGMYLPMNLGWWAVKTWTGARGEPTFPDDIEYLMCKAIGGDMGISLMGVNPDNIDKVPAYQRLAPIFRQYEELRHAKYFPDSIKQQLREPGKDFTQEKASDGKWQFRQVNYDKHKVSGLDGNTNVWQTTNPYGEQPLRVRIEALLSAAPYDSPDGVVIEDFGKPSEAFTGGKVKPGVTGALTRSTEQTKVGDASGCYTATSTNDEPRGSWIQMVRAFSPELNIDKKQALGVWVHGDGQDELLNIQLKSPDHIAGGIGDGYIRVNFTGWRYFELIENEGANMEKWGWPYGGGYSVSREDISFANVSTLSLWYNNLPKSKAVTCYISPIKALPTVDVTLKNPRLTVGGKTITFPVEITSGSYLEFASMDDCKLYGKNGELLSDVKPQGDLPTLAAGTNGIEFQCDSTGGPTPRARVTAITRGNVL
ncbi:MAG: hypothetical protein K1Y02_19445 [Candidatus Hydrogenedentes bacterium]|nr:hypothetical protein [Candidatus Hydrogenedentota bacterium]